MRVTTEMKEAVRERRKAVWLAHARDGVSLRDLRREYEVSLTTLRHDLYEWTKVIAKAAKIFGFPCLEVIPIETSVTWLRHPRTLRLYEKGYLIRDLCEVNFHEGYQSLIRLLGIREIALERYPFDPDTHPYFNRSLSRRESVQSAPAQEDLGDPFETTFWQ